MSINFIKSKSYYFAIKVFSSNGLWKFAKFEVTNLTNIFFEFN